jgi:cyclic pyranopterin phosphate synthase
MVVKRGTNEQEILPMARHFKGTGVALRFIEYMDVGATNGWQMDQVVPSNEVLKRIRAEMPLIALESTQSGETAQRWGYTDVSGRHDPTAGEVGFISSVTQAFCGDCNRARLSTEGQLYLCLFAGQGHDLRSLLRSGADDQQLQDAIARVWGVRKDQYSVQRGAEPTGAGTATRRVEMSYIGG